MSRAAWRRIWCSHANGTAVALPDGKPIAGAMIMIVNALASYAAVFAGSKSAPVATTALPTATPSASATQVTISDESRRRKSGEDRLAGLISIQHHLHGGSPGQADRMARDFAYEDYTHGGLGGLIDSSGWDPGGDGILRYSATGEPVTAESKAYFNKVEADFRQQRIGIYESETAKGTPPAVIYDKLVAAMNAQPARFREMMDWPLDYPDDFTRGTSYDRPYANQSPAPREPLAQFGVG